MGFQILPTNIGGVNLNSITGPLSSLLTPQNAQNLIYPSDLGSNPAMGHAVVFTVFDYQTGLGNAISNISAGNIVNNLVENVKQVGTAAAGVVNSFSGGLSAIEESLGKLAGTVEQNPIIQGLETVYSASSYKPLTQGSPLTTISLFMPDSLSVQYSSTYDKVSLTKELGLPGLVANAISDYKQNGLKDGVTPYAKAAAARAVGSLPVLGDNIGGLTAQALGVFTNPQIQLLYKGIELRTFQLQFIFTPKSAAEAQVTKNICDSFAYYSLPGISGAQVGNSGQFLTPPQIFKIDFKFLGQNSIGGTISNVFNTALNKIGLGFLTGGQGAIDSGSAAKTFTVNDCVLEDVIIDYTPNGWATYDDGYPVQTQLTLQFKETTMITKQQFSDSQVAANYNQKQDLNSSVYGVANKASGYQAPNVEE